MKIDKKFIFLSIFRKNSLWPATRFRKDPTAPSCRFPRKSTHFLLMVIPEKILFREEFLKKKDQFEFMVLLT